MKHPDFEIQYISPMIGVGLFAKTFIPKGTICYTRDPLDCLIDIHDPKLASPLLQDKIQKYAYRTRAGLHNLCWDEAKYVNHSCDPNVLALPHPVGSTCTCECSVAIRDIQPGEQWCEDYGQYYDNLHDFMVNCLCGSPRCRTIVGNIQTESQETLDNWETLSGKILTQVGLVDQPLLDLAIAHQEGNCYLKQIKTKQKLSA